MLSARNKRRRNNDCQALPQMFEDLHQMKIGATASVVLCGIVLGIVIAMCTHKPPTVDSPHVQSSLERVETVCQPEVQAACAAPFKEPEIIAHATIPTDDPVHMHQTTPNAYNVLVPDWNGSAYRLKTIVNQ